VEYNPFIVLSYKKYQDFITEDLFADPYGSHGIGHAKRVLYLARHLAKYYGITEKEWHVLALACCYHDIGRENDDYDERHGMMSLNKVLTLHLEQKHNLTGVDYEAFRDLVIFHAMPDSEYIYDVDDRVKLMYQILKDADALDRLRFNGLEPNYLRLDKSKEMISLALALLRADKIIK
jgi:HD superfamily phosphodiesterase